MSHLGSKYMLPIGTERKLHEVSCHRPPFPSLIALQEYEEVTIPPAKPVPPRQKERLISIGELDELAKLSFPVRTFYILKN